MRATVVPAVNETNLGALQLRISRAALFASSIQIDCSDGVFVRRRTPGPVAVARLRIPDRCALELHCMTERPERWLPVALRLRATRFAFHRESISDPRPLIAALRVHRITPVLAVRPRTALATLTPFLRSAPAVLLVAVPPGASGGKQSTETLARVRTLKRRTPRVEVSVDGGIHSDNIAALANAGATRLVVGSAIFSAPNPEQAYRSLTAQLRFR